MNYCLYKKIIEYGLVNIIIMQIPRVFYDLFNIYYKKKNLKLRFNYDCEISIDCDSIVKKEHIIFLHLDIRKQ